MNDRPTPARKAPAGRAAVIIPALWTVFLCAVIVLTAGDFPFRLLAGRAAAIAVAWVSLPVAIAASSGKRSKASGIACLLLGIAAAASMAFSSPDCGTIYNPFTPQQFAFSLDTNFLMRGTVSYYQRTGPFLHGKKTTADGEYMRDRNSIYVAKSRICVNSTFGWLGGMDFDIRNDSVRLESRAILAWRIRREGRSDTAYFALKKDGPALAYSRHGDKEGRAVCLSQEQFDALARRFEGLPLADFLGDGAAYRYTLELELSRDKGRRPGDAPFYCALVDGEEIWTLLSNAYDGGGGER